MLPEVLLSDARRIVTKERIILIGLPAASLALLHADSLVGTLCCTWQLAWATLHAWNAFWWLGGDRRPM